MYLQRVLLPRPTNRVVFRQSCCETSNRTVQLNSDNVPSSRLLSFTQGGNNLSGRSSTISNLNLFSTSSVHRDEIQPNRFQGWTTVYRFPYIVPIGVMCRLKLYQTGITALAVPLSISLLVLDKVTPQTVGVLSGVCGLATVMLFAMGEIFRKVVGFIYLSPNKEEVIISHLTWFGHRKDLLVNLSDIIPPEEVGESIHQPYWKIKFFDSDDFFFISTRFGGIKSKAAFNHIFGNS